MSYICIIMNIFLLKWEMINTTKLFLIPRPILFHTYYKPDFFFELLSFYYSQVFNGNMNTFWNTQMLIFT